MQVTFLGTGAAFSPNAYNACILVDRTILLDAGAPLCVHLPRVGVDLTGPRVALLTHFHADHTFGLASLILGRALLDGEPAPLSVVGPYGTGAYLEQLLDLAWGEEMRRLAWSRLPLTVREVQAGDGFDVDGGLATAFPMRHSSRFPCLGFVIDREGVRLGYTGDAQLSAGLDDLLGACDHVVVEMTYDEPGPMHLSRTEVRRLMDAHPRVRFIVTHRGSDGEVSGAVLARDFLTLSLPLR